MMKASPTPFKMSEPELLLELLIVALDAPTQKLSATVDQSAEGDVFRKSRAVFGRLVLAATLNQQPLLQPAVSETAITMRDPEQADTPRRGQPVGRTFPPLDCLPCALGQSESSSATKIG